MPAASPTSVAMASPLPPSSGSGSVGGDGGSKTRIKKRRHVASLIAATSSNSTGTTTSASLGIDDDKDDGQRPMTSTAAVTALNAKRPRLAVTSVAPSATVIVALDTLGTSAPQASSVLHGAALSSPPPTGDADEPPHVEAQPAENEHPHPPLQTHRHPSMSTSTRATAAARDLRPPPSAGLPDWLAHPDTIISADLAGAAADGDIADDAGTLLSRPLLDRLRTIGVRRLFPVQRSVLPLLLAPATSRPRDLLVAAPTGSGKTLAYVLPILQALAPRTVVRLRALVVVPTRDLAAQVKATFDSLIAAAAAGGSSRFGSVAPLRVATVSGASPFHVEQEALVAATAAGGTPRGGEDWDLHANAAASEADPDAFPARGASKIDILIATPGRLTDHVRATPGFTLRHLRYLVVDEADRLLAQSYHDWVGVVLAAARAPSAGAAADLQAAHRRDLDAYFDSGAVAAPLLIAPAAAEPGLTLAPAVPNDDGVAASSSLWTAAGFPADACGFPMPDVTSLRPDASTARLRRSRYHTPVLQPLLHPQPLQKLLFSATLTRNPAKIAALDLHRPLLIATAASAPAAATAQQGVTSSQSEVDAAVLPNRSAFDSTPAAAAGVPSAVEDGDGAATTAAGEHDDRYAVPPTLVERLLVCDDPADRPVALLHALFAMTYAELHGTAASTSSTSVPDTWHAPAAELGGVLVFTPSVEAAHRLAALLRNAHGALAANTLDHPPHLLGGRHLPRPRPADALPFALALTSDLAPRERRRALAALRSGRLPVLVASDVGARGIDLDSSSSGGGGDAHGGAVRLVINYGPPPSRRAYVHRVGRTARAGRPGAAVTLLDSRHARWFKHEVAGPQALARPTGSRGLVRVRIDVTAEVFEGLREVCRAALARVAGE
ncbi:ATP-dependent RNA helicase dbp6, partial [Cladochytrium tenue]